jgi:hypothetical protein
VCEAGADISAKCADQNSLLTWAIRNHWGDLLNLLLTSAWLARSDLTLALSATVKRGLVSETELLLKHGADATVQVCQKSPISPMKEPYITPQKDPLMRLLGRMRRCRMRKAPRC